MNASSLDIIKNITASGFSDAMSRSISSGITSSVSGGNFDTTSEEISSSLYREWSNRASFYNFARSGITEENRAPNSILTQNCPEKVSNRMDIFNTI